MVACGGGEATQPTDLEGSGPEVHVFSATVTPGSGDTADAELALHNAGAEPDQLVGVSCACATAAEIHDVSQAGDEGPVDQIRLPVDETVFFGVGGPHIVLLGWTGPLSPGDTVTLDFTFEIAPPTSAVATVEQAPTPSPAT